MFLVCSISWDSVQLFCPYQILLIEKKIAIIITTVKAFLYTR